MGALPIALAGIIASLAGGIDLVTGKIPNWLTLTGLALGLGLGFALGAVEGLLAAFCGALIAVFVPAILFYRSAMGGGDVKLFAALGALLGAAVVLEIEMLAFCFGTAQGLVLWWRRGQLVEGLRGVVTAIRPSRRVRGGATAGSARATEIRFGPAIAISTGFVLLLRLWD